MEQSPDNKGPVCTVPETAGQKDDENVKALSADPPAVSTQRNINVLGKKAGQRDVPSSPEISDGDGHQRGAEVHGKVKSHHFSDSPGHIAVTAEIKVKFHHIENDRDPCGGCIQIRDVVKFQIDRNGERVCQKHLFCKTQNKKRRAVIKIIRCFRASPPVVKLGDPFIMHDNGTGDQLWEKCDKAAIVQKRMAVGVSAETLNNVGDLLESKKADSQRQSNLLNTDMCMEKKIAVINKEIKVFKIKQDSEIPQNTGCKNKSANFIGAGFSEQDTAAVV